MEAEKKKKRLIFILVIVTTIYFVWRLFFTIPKRFGTLSTILGLILVSAELTGFIESLVHYYTLSNGKSPETPIVKEVSNYPHVDIFIATVNEPVDLLYKTLNGCINMDYPDKNKVHIYVCDDGNRDEVKKLTEELNVNYITREDREGAKAGNLNNAMSKTSSPYIVTLDCDMIPMHDFLMVSMPFFVKAEIEDKDKEKIGFIQLPQSFYNPDVFQYNLFAEDKVPNEQEYFYKEVEVGKNSSNSVIYGGSNTILSREALNEIGGFVTDVITEDIATGMLIQSKGYKCLALGSVHASGLATNDLDGILKQRSRWARGCIQTFQKYNPFFIKGLDFKQKLNYFAAIIYWYSGINRLIYIISPILFSVFGIRIVDTNIIEVIIFWLPMYIVSLLALSKLSGRARSKKWSNIYETIMLPRLVPVVILETLGIRQKKFVVTRKDGKVINSHKDIINLVIPHIIMTILTIIGLINCIRLLKYNAATAIFVGYWLVINLYTLVMALLFIFGRKKHRVFERFPIQTDSKIYLNDDVIDGYTNDISEIGISFMLKFPYYFDNEKDYKIFVKREGYKSIFKGRLVYVTSSSNQYKYAFRIVDINKENYNQLLNILYDREPALPVEIENNSIYDDIVDNIRHRMKKEFQYKRKYPRVNLNSDVTVLNMDNKEEVRVNIKDFNYLYFRIETTENIENLKIVVRKCKFYCIKDHELTPLREQEEKNNIYMYKVVNYKNLIYSDELKDVINNWINS